MIQQKVKLGLSGEEAEGIVGRRAEHGEKVIGAIDLHSECEIAKVSIMNNWKKEGEFLIDVGSRDYIYITKEKQSPEKENAILSLINDIRYDLEKKEKEQGIVPDYIDQQNIIAHNVMRYYISNLKDTNSYIATVFDPTERMGSQHGEEIIEILANSKYEAMAMLKEHKELWQNKEYGMISTAHTEDMLIASMGERGLEDAPFIGTIDCQKEPKVFVVSAEVEYTPVAIKVLARKPEVASEIALNSEKAKALGMTRGLVNTKAESLFIEEGGVGNNGKTIHHSDFSIEAVYAENGIDVSKYKMAGRINPVNGCREIYVGSNYANLASKIMDATEEILNQSFMRSHFDKYQTAYKTGDKKAQEEVLNDIKSDISFAGYKTEPLVLTELQTETEKAIEAKAQKSIISGYAVELERVSSDEVPVPIEKGSPLEISGAYYGNIVVDNEKDVIVKQTEAPSMQIDDIEESVCNLIADEGLAKYTVEEFQKRVSFYQKMIDGNPSAFEKKMAKRDLEQYGQKVIGTENKKVVEVMLENLNKKESTKEKQQAKRNTLKKNI